MEAAAGIQIGLVFCADLRQGNCNAGSLVPISPSSQAVDLVRWSFNASDSLEASHDLPVNPAHSFQSSLVMKSVSPWEESGFKTSRRITLPFNRIISMESLLLREESTERSQLTDICPTKWMTWRRNQMRTHIPRHWSPLGRISGSLSHPHSIFAARLPQIVSLPEASSESAPHSHQICLQRFLFWFSQICWKNLRNFKSKSNYWARQGCIGFEQHI